MADPRATPVTFANAVRLCLLLLFSQERFVEAERQDNEARNARTERPPLPHAAVNVRNALSRSFLLVAASATAGVAAGWFMAGLKYCATPGNVAALQVVGASLLLWATLFVRGFEIQTNAGVTLTERVNQWLYRFLYCVGTALIVYSLAFQLCV